jgi:arylsulfatase A-like enzyme
VVATCLACSDAPPRHAIVIVVDTLRWDHLGAYGSRRPTSPTLDRLAREGVRFERAYAPAPWTKPSVASLLTGLYPSGHGVETMKEALAARHTTLAEILSGRGFQTGAVISHILLAETAGSGLGQGFETFSETPVPNVITTPGVTAEAIELLRRFHADGRRFLLFLHYFDPHFEYLAHPEYGFAPPRAGRLDGRRGILELRAMRDTFSEEEVAFLRARYDEEIRFTDEGIGRLLAEVDELGLGEETVVVVTADHGEEFLERGWLGHTRTLYEELVRVPLIVRVARSGARVAEVRDPVSIVSVVPTVLELLGIDDHGLVFQAPSLADAIHGGEVPAATIVSEVDWVPVHPLHKLGPVSKQAVIEGGFKVIRDTRSNAIEIYDLERDPLERENLASGDPELERRMLTSLGGAMRRIRELPKVR